MAYKNHDEGLLYFSDHSPKKSLKEFMADNADGGVLAQCHWRKTPAL